MFGSLQESNGGQTSQRVMSALGTLGTEEAAVHLEGMGAMREGFIRRGHCGRASEEIIKDRKGKQ